MGDMFHLMVVQQGYVPITCTMPGEMCWLLVQSQGNPCNGCNADRKVCNGRRTIEGVIGTILEPANDESIKSCPFCGSIAKYIEYQKQEGNLSHTVGLVCCDSAACGCRTRDVIVDGYYGVTTTKQDAIDIWNRRNK